MRLCVWCFVLTWIWTMAYGSIYVDLPGVRTRKKPKLAQGVEFDKISRSTLLKMLATFEESVNTRLAPFKLRPQFTAQFANNKYTRPFIYPHVFKKSKINVKPDPGFCTRVGWMQVGYALWVNMTEVSVGMAYGFAAVSLPHIASPEDIMNVTMHEGNWIATVLSMAAPIGCLIMGLVMDRWGRRPAMLLCKVPLCVGWLYTGFAPSSIHVIVGVVITGMGCGMAISPPRVYIAEASLPNMRGTLSAFPPLASAIGIALQACLAWMFSWKIVCFISALYTASLIVSDFFLPETPYFLLTQHDTSEEIEHSLRKLRGPKYDMQQELEEILDFKTTNEISKLNIYGTLKAILTMSAWKPFAIIAGYMFIEQMSGASIMIVWTIEILTDSRSTVNPNVGDAMMSTARFCTAIVLTGLLYKLSRRFLALTSSVGVGVVCFQIFLFLMLSAKRHVFPQICYVFYVMFATLGYTSLPFMYMAEIFPLQVRGIMGGVSLTFWSIVTFGVIKLYPIICALIGLPYIMLIFSVSSLLGCLFVAVFLPETKNLTLPEIEEYFKGFRATLVSQRQVRASQLYNASQNSSITQQASKTSANKPEKDKTLVKGPINISGK